MTAQETTENPTLAPATDLSATPAGRTVRSVGHGRNVVPVPPQPDGVDPRVSAAPLLPGTARAVYDDVRAGTFDATTRFDYLFPGLRDDPAAHLPSGEADAPRVLAALNALGEAMVEPAGPDPARDSSVPAVYTYWGQFVDHDITLNTNGRDSTGDPGSGDLVLGDIVDEPFRVVPPDVVVASLHNGRHPALNLDSVYGSGPVLPGERGHGTTRSEASYATSDPVKLALGRVATTPVPGFALVEPGADAQRDLPRFSAAEVATLVGAPEELPKAGDPKIPDARNDENLVVGQFQVGMIRFHNAVVDWVRQHEPELADDRAVFDRARQLVRHHYQWLVVHDYLRTLTAPGVLDQVLLGDRLLFAPPYPIAMPLEFATAAFRFGHSMVRGAYDFNVNFTAGGPGGVATLDQLFQFTGGGGLGAPDGARGDALPSNWPIEWARFVRKGEPVTARAARTIDPFLAASLADLRNEGNDPGLADGVRAMLKHLARRNLVRGYWLSLPTGEAVAQALGVAPLTAEQLTAGAAPEVGEALAGLGATPLWYYVLKEAEAQGGGSFLGEVGSRVLAETFAYLLRRDEGSFLRTSPEPWTPADGVRLDDGRMITTLVDLQRFAGVLPLPDGSFRQDGGRPAGHDGDA
ncbi:heme peroxidase family protein [Isoptericola sp. F-RaC21]|uniref:peroxidase family protein n=1 Tax=Isoptericola sp. F-RaC21 TaxID=3141452 RepID=UPI00315B51C6